MMKRFFFCIGIILFSTTIFAQVEKRKSYSLNELGLFPYSSEGQVIISSDERLPQIIKGYVNYLYKKPLRAWRVQLYFGLGRKGREQAEKVKAQFASLYPDIPVYIFFEQPYFKVKAGNFIDRAAAARLLFLIKSDFPQAYIIEDRIDPNNITE